MLETATAPEVGTAGGLDSAGAVLAAARAQRAGADRLEAQLLESAVAWAAMHSVDSIHEAAVVDQFGECAVAVAGPGAPLVAEFSVADFAAAASLSTDAGRMYLGEAVELRYRLPRCWARVMAGELVSWKARRIARTTFMLSMEAAGFVDAQVAHYAHRVGPVQLDRLVAEATARFMPEEAERQRREAADGRFFTVSDQVDGLRGTSEIRGVLDLADALDLEDAVAAGARALKELGGPESVNARRAMALGVLARNQRTLDLTAARGSDGDPPVRPARGSRQVVLYVHLTEDALTGGSNVGRCENTRSPITVEQIRTWCGTPGAVVTVKPVLDLADQVRVDAYEIPDRMREVAGLVDVTCVFPWCTRPARACDVDHCQPYDGGGATATDNLAPLCRRHHRLKTHGSWRYTVIDRGAYRWTDRFGHQWLRDADGTTDLTPDRRPGDPADPIDRAAGRRRS